MTRAQNTGCLLYFDLIDLRYHCFHRTGIRTFSSGDIHKIDGSWVNGFLEGRATIEYIAGDYIEGFYKLGVLHGVARTWGITGDLKEIRFAKKMQHSHI